MADGFFGKGGMMAGYVLAGPNNAQKSFVQKVAVVDDTGAAVGSAAFLPAGTNRSGTATTTAQALIPANASRKGLRIQNIGANNIGVNEIGGTAAIGTAGTYTLAPGASESFHTNRVISMIAATLDTAFTATEW